MYSCYKQIKADMRTSVNYEVSIGLYTKTLSIHYTFMKQYLNSFDSRNSIKLFLYFSDWIASSFLKYLNM